MEEESSHKRKPEKKEKKEKKTKKDKKYKKDKKRLKKENEEEEEVWVERTFNEDSNILQDSATETISSSTNKEPSSNGSYQRESWMLKPPSKSTTNVGDEDSFINEGTGKSTKPEETDQDNKIHSREINPYWKGGSEGYKTDENSSKPIQGIGDKGASWRYKAVLRAKEYAEYSGLDVSTVLKERFGEGADKILLEAETFEKKNRSHSSSHSHRSSSSHKSSSHRSSSPSSHHSSSSPPRSSSFHRSSSSSSHHSSSSPPRSSSSHRSSSSSSHRSSSKHSSFERTSYSSGFQRPGSFSLSSQSSTSPHSQTSNRSSILASTETSDPSQNSPPLNSTPVTIINPSPSLTADINRIAAEMVRAQLLQQTDSYEKLKKQLEELRNQQNAETVIPMDQFGRVTSSIRSKEPSKKDRYNSKEENEEDVDVQTLKEREMNSSNKNYDNFFAQKIVKNYKYSGITSDEMDDQITWGKKSSKPDKKNQKKQKNQEAIQQQRAIQAHNKMTQILENCWFCFDSPKIDKSLIAAIGNHTYLALPKRGRLVPGHCLILPLQHLIAANSFDESVMEEIQLFQKSLVKMFKKQKRDIIFFELAMEFKKQRHTFIECVPLPLDLAQEAPVYFKKAILEAESEWAQHKKVITIPPKVGIGRCVPKGFPYFYVEFGLDGGFAHVIEDEEKFPRTFAREIVAGMLKLPHEEWIKPKDELKSVLQDQVKDFVKEYLPFDWTTELEGGEI